MEVAASDAFHWFLLHDDFFDLSILPISYLIVHDRDLDWIYVVLIVFLLAQLVIEPKAPAIELPIHGNSQAVSPAGLHVLNLDFVLCEPGNLAWVVQGNQVALPKPAEIRLTTSKDLS